MVSADRQQVIETNRSLRNIKNELEALLEKGVITEDAFDSIHRLLPTEGSLSGAVAHRAPAPAPPSYAQSTGGSTNAAPPLPGRNQPPAPPPSKPVVAHCRALYKYEAQDARDVSFDKGDSISVYEKMNADWWMGANVRTGQEGIFPKAYVEVDESAGAGASGGMGVSSWGNEKSGAIPAPYQQQPAQGQYGNGGGYPPAPGRVDPYNAHAPPMAMANHQSGGGGEEGGSKASEQGKKFGKKLGNAAIFGAGATIGGKIVNSIF